jgi:predicted tellurium resistance membrane protein TerC
MISIPIVMFGSQLVLKLVERWPLIITVGGIVLAVTAAQMVSKEELISNYFASKAWNHDLFYWCSHVLFVGCIVFASWVNSKRQSENAKSSDLETP